MRFSLGRAVCCLLLLTVPAQADCGAEIRAVVRKAIESGPYIAVTTSQTGDISTGVTAEIDGAGNMHSFTSEGAGVNELILVNGRGWTRIMGQWQEVLPSAAKGLGKTVVRDRMAFIEGMEQPACNGEVVFQEQKLLSYSVVYAQGGANSASTLLVDPQTGLLAHMLTRTLAGGQTTRTVTSFTFGVNFEIEAPTQ